MFKLLCVAALLHLYIGLRLVPDLAAGAGVASAVALALWLLVSSVAMPLAMLSRPMPSPRRERLAWTGFLFMGAFSCLWVLCVLRDLLLLGAGTLGLLGPGAFGARELAWLLDPLARQAAWLGQAAQFPGAALVPLLALAASALGLFEARRLPRVRKVRVPIAALPAALEGLRIVQISDVHVGPTIGRAWLARVVDCVNGLQPDLVAITGDLVDGSVEQLRNEVAPLARLQAPLGVHCVTGNHEYYSGAPAWVAELRRLGITVLMNEHRVLERHGASLVIAGITDFGAAQFTPQEASNPQRALAGAPAATPRVLLAHQPRSCFAAAPHGVQLQLSGHTHGGQFLPWPWFVRLQQPYTAGLHRHGAMWVYVSRGTGYWGPPLRLGAPAEISLITLHAALD